MNPTVAAIPDGIHTNTHHDTTTDTLGNAAIGNTRGMPPAEHTPKPQTHPYSTHDSHIIAASSPKHRSSVRTAAWRRAKQAVMKSSASPLRHHHRSSSSPPGRPGIPALADVAGDGSAIIKLPGMAISRQEFEALPPAIQRKHFSALERLRLARDLVSDNSLPNRSGNHRACITAKNTTTATKHSYSKSGIHLPPGTATSALEPGSDINRRPTFISPRTPSASKSLDLESRHRPRFTSLDQQIYTDLPDKIKRRHLSEEEQLIARHQQFIEQHHPRSATVSSETDPTDADINMPLLCEAHTAQAVKMTPPGVPESFYDSFDWLDQNDGLDLRLDDYQNKPEQSKPALNRRQNFRQQFSRSKLSFARSDSNSSRLSTKDLPPVPSAGPKPSLAPISHGHSRRKSRALSLISVNKLSIDSPTALDAAASHFRDPQARLKLEYLSSPQKFDEAIQFGFPSVEEPALQNQQSDDPIDQLRTFLEDDRSSICSDNSTIVDMDSPKTPPIMDRPLPLQPMRVCTDSFLTLHGNYSQMPMREMTLRMTLTRSDLRADEDEIYGWQKSMPDRKVHVRGESSAPIKNFRDMTPKASIEQQFAAFDRENMQPHDNGTFKRLWKRVLRG